MYFFKKNYTNKLYYIVTVIAFLNIFYLKIY